MKLLFLISFLPAFIPSATVTNPLEGFDLAWKDAKYASCNTARNIKYLSAQEKEVIFILNLVRQYPQQFNKTVVAKWPEFADEQYLSNNTFYNSLVADLNKMQPAQMLTADSLCWISAKCHAASSGEKGYVGHERQSETCKKQEKFWAECCQYGYNSALHIVMNLLIDENVESLGHRITCLSNAYKAVGVSLKPHATYSYNTVLDFTY